MQETDPLGLVEGSWSTWWLIMTTRPSPAILRHSSLGVLSLVRYACSVTEGGGANQVRLPVRTAYRCTWYGARWASEAERGPSEAERGASTAPGNGTLTCDSTECTTV